MSVAAAESRVHKRVEILDKCNGEVERIKGNLDKARTSRVKAQDSLKVARASLATIKKKKASPKPPADKRITAQPKKGSAQPLVCTVCRKPAVEVPIEVLECGCPFHLRCIQRWVKADKQDCPTCLATDLFMKFRG